MAAIKIKWLTDTSECEDCGTSYADGAIVYIDGVEAIDLSPAAHCYGGTNFDNDDVLVRIIEHLGHTIVEEWDGKTSEQTT